MTYYIIMAAMIIFLCLTASSISNKMGIPTLILFIGLGMLFGSEGIVGIQFENYDFANYICSFVLIYIMFYGGFGINLKMAKPVAVKASLLSTLGVILTMLITGVFCHLVLKMDLLESCLLGSVVGCTDAAAVFYILRAKKLNLKNGLASLIEMESGSNDPAANILTIILLGIMQGTDIGPIPVMLLKQLIIGLIAGAVLGILAEYGLKKFQDMNEGLDMIFVFAIALFSYAVSNLLGGNGYLSAYITGIILGNAKIPNKVGLVHFFNGLTSLFQMLVFFLLGLLAFPTEVISYLLPALLVGVFLTCVARPLAVAILLTPFKTPLRDQIFISVAGLRGASSIVFAITVTVSGIGAGNKIFNMVFCIAMLSIAIQGALLPMIAKKLDLIDDEAPVSMTFNDYQNDTDVKLLNILISKNHPWIGKKLSEITFPHRSLVVFIKRGFEVVIPRGDTVLEPEDIVILSSEYQEEPSELEIQELTVGKNNEWIGKSIAECDIPKETIIIMVKRKEGNVVPSGSTVIKANDVLLTCGLRG
ncbi:MAG: potassium/proton antiporter [Cellulosilyticum sp.]|nr:potassium/proton antiporter [Cellulosilyticum sp.]